MIINCKDSLVSQWVQLCDEFEYIHFVIMTITLEKVLRPYFIVCFIMGLKIYPVQLKPRFLWIKYLSILYSSIIWLIYSYYFYYMITLFSLKIILLSTVIIIMKLLYIIAAIISTIKSFYHHKVWLYIFYFLLHMYIKTCIKLKHTKACALI